MDKDFGDGTTLRSRALKAIDDRRASCRPLARTACAP
jgi:hypothetical protein